jgi:hypothetical protein
VGSPGTDSRHGVDKTTPEFIGLNLISTTRPSQVRREGIGVGEGERCFEMLETDTYMCRLIVESDLDFERDRERAGDDESRRDCRLVILPDVEEIGLPRLVGLGLLGTLGQTHKY